MNAHEAPEFEHMLADVAELVGKARPSEGAALLWWAALEPYPWPQVRAAFGEHIRRSSFMPRPADLIAILNERDGRPTAEEAWAVAILAQDEGATVVWTHETAAAWNEARSLLDARDQVAARMTFRDAYNRMVGEARAELRPVVWTTSIGSDASRREGPLRQAAAKGLIHADMLVALLPPPVEDTAEAADAEATVKLLTGKVSDYRAPTTDAGRRFRAAVMAGLAQAERERRAVEGPRNIPETDTDRELVALAPWAWASTEQAG
jgi:hypothetical protein